MDIFSILDMLVAGILRGGLYALIALGVAMIFGVMNIPNFTHGEYYMVGAYIAYFSFVLFEMNPLLCIIAAGIGGFIFGGVIDFTVFRVLRKRSKGNWIMNSFLICVGLSVLIQNLAQNVMGVRYRGIIHYWEGVIQLLPNINSSLDRFYGFLIALFFVAGFWIFMHYTKVGNMIRAVSDNETGSKLVGINLPKIHFITFSLGCMIAAIAGATLLPLTPAFPAVGMAPLYKAWTVVILVGMGNVWGTIIGGILLGIIETFSYYYLGQGWQNVLIFSVIVLVMAVKPSGLFSKGVRGVWDQ